MNQPPPQPRCSSCGASLSLDDLRGTNCRYCGTALPHHARAAEQAALVNLMLNQQLQARGLAVPANPLVPYQYGAPPAMPPTPPMLPGMMFQGTDVTRAAGKTITTVVVVGVIAALFMMMICGGALWFFLA